MPRTPIAMLVCFGLLVSACAADGTAGARAASSREPPTIDTGPWLRTIASPPPAWRSVVMGREDVIRHRFVRFDPPARAPDPESRFIVRPFADTRIVLRMRRAGPSGDDAYAWFGAYEDDSRGWGGLVVRRNGRVVVDIQTPEGARYQVVDVAPEAYAVLELARRPHRGDER